MPKKIIKSILWLYLRLIRIWKSPLIYWLFKLTKYRGKSPNVWDNIKDLPINEFHQKICHRTQYDYYLDPLGGVLDNSPRQKNFFFRDDLTTSRDCSAWARMWYWYHKYHNREVYEIVILDTDPVVKFNDWKPYINAHKLTVTKIGSKYQLFDYRPVSQKEDSIEKVLQHNVVNFNDFIWVINKK